MIGTSGAPAFVSGPKPPVHLCGIFESDFERRAALRKFFRAGLFAGERCVILIDADDPTYTLSAIGTADEVARWRDEHLLTVLSASTCRNASNGFGIDMMIDVWKNRMEEGRPAPTRLGGEVTWLLRLVTQEKLLEYEEELERSMPQHISVLCLYDRRRFGADVLQHAREIHPHKVTASRMFVVNDEFRARASCEP